MRFPPWLQQLLYFLGVIVAVTMSYSQIKSDVRSIGEEVNRLTGDLQQVRGEVTTVRSLLPNAALYDLKMAEFDKRLDQLRADLDLEREKQQKFRENLLAKGVLR